MLVRWYGLSPVWKQRGYNICVKDTMCTEPQTLDIHHCSSVSHSTFSCLIASIILCFFAKCEESLFTECLTSI